MDKPDIKKLAKLAKIELMQEEEGIFSEQIYAILDYVSQINELDTETINETIQLETAKSRFRKDKVINCDKDIVKNLQNDSNFSDSYFNTKTVF